LREYVLLSIERTRGKGGRKKPSGVRPDRRGDAAEAHTHGWVERVGKEEGSARWDIQLLTPLTVTDCVKHKGRKGEKRYTVALSVTSFSGPIAHRPTVFQKKRGGKKKGGKSKSTRFSHQMPDQKHLYPSGSSCIAMMSKDRPGKGKGGGKRKGKKSIEFITLSCKFRVKPVPGAPLSLKKKKRGRG